MTYEAAVNAVNTVMRRVDELVAEQGGGAAASRRLSPQEAANLPPGTPFVGMDGVERVRQ